MKEETKDISLKKRFIDYFVRGLGWAFGLTFGITILITLLTYILNLLGGLPLVGKFFGQIIENTVFYLNSGLK